MCGFVGVLRSAAAGPVGEAELRALLPWIRHRGPDQEGVYVQDGFGLAAARLRVRGGPEGDQPLSSADGSTVVAFNGELLFHEAAVGVSAHGCDTPVFLAGDEDCLRGNMGAVVRWEPETGRLDLARDPLGIKPLYVAQVEDGSVWFASELKPLLQARPELRAPDREGLAQLLHFHRPRGRLPFAGVEALPVADAATGTEPPFASEDEAVAAVRDAWREAARAAAAGNGPVSLLLSGGLDSSAVAAWAGRDDLLCLTGRFGGGEEYDESDAAAAVARHAGLQHEVLDLRDEDLVADLPEVIAALEMPIAGPGSLALWRMAKRARAHGRVVLTGTGGDELFGGYARTALALGKAGTWTRGYEPLRSRIEAAGEDPGARMRAAFDRSGDLRAVLAPDFASMLPEPPPLEPAEGMPLVHALLQEERSGTLAALLQVEDRVTMAHGLEGRPVACLGALPDVARRLPEDWLVGPDGEGKRALRAALRGAIPESVRTDPRKRGFPTPFARAARGAGRERVQDWLAERRFRERGWWQVDACRALLGEERPGYDRALFAVLSWEWWARLFLDGDCLDGDAFAGTKTP